MHTYCLICKSPGTEPVQEIQEVYKAFKLVYDKLHVDKKPCLLYWEFFPDYEVFQEQLIECWKTEQFIVQTDEGSDMLMTKDMLLREFENNFFFERGSKAGHFEMPPFFPTHGSQDYGI
jgi:hypothetical protein